jgi:CRP-like cAMP-binding protein
MAEAVADKIDAYFSRYPKRTYPKGQILVFAHESPEHIFYIVKGQVSKYDVSYRGDEVIVNIFKPPAFFPMSWAINQTPNNFFYKTESETELHIAPAADALKFLQDNPDVTLDLLGRVYRGMEGLLGRVVHLMSGTAKSRLIYELITEAKRFSKQEKDGTYKIESRESDLAARTGLTRETVSREMKKLKNNGWVEVGPKFITILKLEELQKASGEEL